MNRRVARHTLAMRYPVIATALARTNENPTLLAINAAIDRGEPVDKAIADIVGVSQAAIHCLGLIPADVFVEEWLAHPIELFWAMDVLHPLEIPQTLNEWGVLRKLWAGTGLGQQDAYRSAAKARRERQIVLEYLLRGLSAEGYGKRSAALADRLVAPLPGIEAGPEDICPFHCYVDFVEESVLFASEHGSAGAWSRAEHLMMRYSPTELIRQWERWRCVIAAHGNKGDEIASYPNDTGKIHWIMQLAIPNFDEAVRWSMYLPS